jgi:hypothetical protein
MPGYRCFFFGADNHILRRVEYYVDTDDLAIAEGRHRYAAQAVVFGKFGFEVWQEARFVHSEDRLSQNS